MTITTRIRGELFVTQAQSSSDERHQSSDGATPASPQLIRLPLTRPPDGPASAKKPKKKAKRVLKQPTKVKVKAASVPLEDRQTSHRHGLPWTTEEHDRFLQGLERYPTGPWKAVAAFVGTRTPRQTMTHAQKYRQKIQRRRRGLLTSSRQPVPQTSAAYCGLVITTSAENCEQTPSASSSNSKSPTAVDVVGDERMAPLEPNWFDKVQVGELDAAFRAFLEVYDPTLFPMEDDAQPVVANTFTGDMDCNVSMVEDCMSIAL